MPNYNANRIKKSALFHGLNNEEFEALFPTLSPAVKTFEKNEIVLRQGEVAKQIGVLLSGNISSVKYHYDGSSQILKILSPYDIIGLESASSSFLTNPYMSIASSRCCVVFLTYSELLTSQNVPDSHKHILWQNVISILSDENIRLIYKIDTLSKRTLRERILTYLNIMREKRGTDTFDIGMTQAQFALYLCVNRSSLSHELNQMRRDGLIDFKKSIYTLHLPPVLAE